MGACMEHRIKEDSPVSPGTVGPSGPNYFSDIPTVPTKGRGMTGTFRDHRRELAVLDHPSNGVPAISKEPPSAPLAQIAPWATESSTMPSTAMLPPARSFFDDRDDDPLSTYRPGTSRTDTSESLDVSWHADERRPSVASATTVGSQDSSIRAGASRWSNHKKLNSFLGEDVSGRNSQQGSDSSVPNSIHSYRRRNNSYQANNINGQAASPSSSRPHTPLPSSEVAPWVFQDFNVS